MSAHGRDSGLSLAVLAVILHICCSGALGSKDGLSGEVHGLKDQGHSQDAFQQDFRQALVQRGLRSAIPVLEDHGITAQSIFASLTRENFAEMPLKLGHRASLLQWWETLTSPHESGVRERVTTTAEKTEMRGTDSNVNVASEQLHAMRNVLDYYGEGMSNLRASARENFWPDWVQSEEPKCVPVRPAIDSTWLLNSCFKILMMQTGFAVVESSFVRERNAANMYGMPARRASRRCPALSCVCDLKHARALTTACAFACAPRARMNVHTEYRFLTGGLSFSFSFSLSLVSESALFGKVPSRLCVCVCPPSFSPFLSRFLFLSLPPRAPVTLCLRLSSMMKNLCDLCFGALGFWSIGWALAYGVDPNNPHNVNGFCGTGHWFMIQGYDYSMWMCVALSSTCRVRISRVWVHVFGLALPCAGRPWGSCVCMFAFIFMCTHALTHTGSNIHLRPRRPRSIQAPWQNA